MNWLKKKWKIFIENQIVKAKVKRYRYDELDTTPLQLLSKFVEWVRFYHDRYVGYDQLQMIIQWLGSTDPVFLYNTYRQMGKTTWLIDFLGWWIDWNPKKDIAVLGHTMNWVLDIQRQIEAMIDNIKLTRMEYSRFHKDQAIAFDMGLAKRKRRTRLVNLNSEIHYFSMNNYELGMRGYNPQLILVDEYKQAVVRELASWYPKADIIGVTTPYYIEQIQRKMIINPLPDEWKKKHESK